jgi:hypothetical protein
VVAAEVSHDSYSLHRYVNDFGSIAGLLFLVGLPTKSKLRVYEFRPRLLTIYEFLPCIKIFMMAMSTLSETAKFYAKRVIHKICCMQ